VKIVRSFVGLNVLLIKYILEDFDRQTSEVKADILDAICSGLSRDLLTITQVKYTIYYSWGFTLSEIAVKHNTTEDRVIELIAATLRYISTVTEYTDEKVIYQAKGRVESHWIVKRDQIVIQGLECTETEMES
jgi:predicted DNA-binding protein YlxM (UPF0122 family)